MAKQRFSNNRGQVDVEQTAQINQLESSTCCLRGNAQSPFSDNTDKK